MCQCKPEVWDISAEEMVPTIPGKCPTRSTEFFAPTAPLV